MAATMGGFAGDHPRLLFEAKDVPALRRKVTEEPWKSMVERLRADVDRNGWANGPANLSEPYEQTVLAQRCAFLYVLTGDDSWAKRAREQVEKRIADGQNWANGGAKGLALYWHGAKISQAFDWCAGAPSWDAAFAARVSAELKRHGDVIRTKGGSGQNSDPASNWQGARFGSAGLCLLATDEAIVEADLLSCHQRVVRYLQENLGTDGRSRGWNSEGLGYTYYPMGNFVGPFGIAMARRQPDKDLRKACAGVDWALWTCFAAHVKGCDGVIRPDFGDDNAGTSGEGAYGLAFYYCPEKLRPGLVWTYDKLWGTKGDRSFDPARGGTIYSILYHPGAATAGKDPMSMSEWREGFVDLGGNGYFTFRNAYRCDETDIVAQLYAKLRGNRGHNGPDALSFRIQGLGTAWAVGGGRYGPKHNGQDAFLRSQDTLYPVDPDAPLTVSDQSARVVGTPLSKPNGGGHVVTAIAKNNVGVTNHKRWFVADFGGVSGAAAFVVCDTSDDGKFWQLCSLSENRIETMGKTFTVAARNGATLQGTVLYPTGDLNFRVGKRPRGSGFLTDTNSFVHAQSGDGCFVVAMTLAPKGRAHPPVSATGAWGKTPAGTVKIGGWSVAIKGDEIMYSP
jgi:hypothetical protein